MTSKLSLAVNPEDGSDTRPEDLRRMLLKEHPSRWTVGPGGQGLLRMGYQALNFDASYSICFLFSLIYSLTERIGVIGTGSAARSIAVSLLLLSARQPDRPALARSMTQEEALTVLAGQRAAAVVCAASLKQKPNKADRDGGAVAYERARGDYNDIITRVGGALDPGGAPTTLGELQIKMKRAVDRMATVCPTNQPLGGDPRQLEEALTTLWSVRLSDGENSRISMQRRLEATRWPAYEGLGN